MSDTPETDALIESCDQHKPHTNFGDALRLARSLERRLRIRERDVRYVALERDTALREVEEWKAKFNRFANWPDMPGGSAGDAALTEQGKP